ncbi:von Willebrand factor-like [Anneissia japonica]|uniref:von Willebrand factor-like n=1 Tax=Anneissia japonica TaxID=1529436 RepID=UPI001425B864|nr:von Willebrand factor-like [Anneissia japonica]
MKVVLLSSLVVLLWLPCNGIRLQRDQIKKTMYSDEINKMILDYLKKMEDDNNFFERDVHVKRNASVEGNVTACDGDPCQHNGVCNLDESSSGYTCDCKGTGYIGNTCESVDTCANKKPCQNGGVCYNNDSELGFYCNCSTGAEVAYGGTVCDILLRSCSVNPCLNGGTCTDGLCHCPVGLHGTLCEKSNNGYTPESSLPPAGQTCSVWDRKNFRTFDGMVYSVNSECSHTLMMEGTGTIFKVSVDFRNNSMAVGVVYNNGKKHISLTLTSNGVVYNSQLITANENLDAVYISFVSHYIILQTDLDFFQIIWNRDNLVEIKMLDDNLAGKLSGMCGNYDGLPSNDAEFNSVVPAIFNPVTMAENWKEYTGECEITDTCVDYNQISQGDLYTCLNMNALFTDCVNIVPIDSYMKACYESACSCQNVNAVSCVCPDYAAYASECSKNGVNVNWRSESFCPFECPVAGEIYNECGSTCVATCEYQDPDCTEETLCLEGCHCSSEHVLLNGNCVKPVECPCFYGNDNYTHSQQVQTECDLCTCLEGEFSCEAQPCGATCWAAGISSYKTFDNKYYEFMGDCEYYLLKDCNVNPGDFEILLQNQHCHPQINGFVSDCKKTVTIQKGGNQVMLSPGPIVYVNNFNVLYYPHELPGIFIENLADTLIKVTLSDGIALLYDGYTRIEVHVEPALKGKTCGLCGTFTNTALDDFLTPSGNVENDVYIFVDKTKVIAGCSDNHEIHLDPCNYQETYKPTAEAQCSELQNADGVLGECFKYLDQKPYYYSCMQDICTDPSQSDGHCNMITQYVSDCAKKGIYLDDWHNSVSGCNNTCPNGLVYKVCANSCDLFCYPQPYNNSCNDICTAGCFCPNGKVFDHNGNCVNKQNCHCLANGRYYPAGYILDSGCSKCLCSEGDFICGEQTCSCGENAVYTTCYGGDTCRKTCSNQYFVEICSEKNCLPGCECKDGYVFDENHSKCVLPTDCPCMNAGIAYDNGEGTQIGCRLW